VSGFHRLRVAEVRPLTDDAAEVVFELPENLREPFSYEHGQHLAVRLDHEGEELRRNYSITGGPGEAGLRIGVRHTPGGRVSGVLTRALRPGDELDVMTPAGRFTAPIDPERSRHWLLIAAGSGITPVMSILRTVLAQEPRSSITLLYVNRGVSSIMFRRELDALKNQHLERLSVLHFLTRERRNVGLFDGRITPEKLITLARTMLPLDQVDHAFICGPQVMTLELRAALIELGLPAANVHMELFATEGSLNGTPPPPPAPDARVVTQATVLLHGIETDVPMYEGERVLDAARRQGLDVPFACTGGVCATCRAHLAEGAVTMAVNYALADDEVSAGYVLTCQSVPRTPAIRVDFDRP